MRLNLFMYVNTIRIVRWIMILVSGLLLAIPNQSQSTADWMLAGTTYIDRDAGASFQISRDGLHIATLNPSLAIFNITSPGYEYLVFYYNGNQLPRWLDSTMIYREYNYAQEIGAKSPECSELDFVTFGYYDTTSDKGNVTFCLIPPDSYAALSEVDRIDTDSLQRFPFGLQSEPAVFVGNRYIVNLVTGTWLDLQGILSTRFNREETIDWVAHDLTWWDPVTQHPMARIESNRFATITEGLVTQSIQMCPMVGDTCETLVKVDDYVYGFMVDLMITPDGQTVLWNAIENQAGEMRGVNSPNTVIDTIAYATDVHTRVTTELFRFSEHNIWQAVGSNARWSEDGLTLAIDLAPVVDSDDTGIFLAEFNRVPVADAEPGG